MTKPLFNIENLRHLPFRKRSAIKPVPYQVTLNQQTLNWLKDHVYTGRSSGYGSVVVELSIRLLLSLLTADPVAMLQMGRDLKQALSEEGYSKLKTNTWLLITGLVDEEYTDDLMAEDIHQAIDKTIKAKNELSS